MTPELAVFGCLTLDNVVTAEGRVLPQSFAGNAIYAALGARLWSDSVGVVARAGDNYPQACFDLLKDLGVDVAGIRRLPQPHGRNMAFFYRADGSRTRQASPEVLAALPPAERDRFIDTTLQPDAREKWFAFSPDVEDAPSGWWPGLRGVHCPAIPMARQARIVSSAKSRHGGKIWAQVDSPWQDKAAQEPAEEAALLSEVDAVLPSEADLDDLLPGATRHAAVKALLHAGARRVVLKRGADGCDIYGHDGRTVHIPTVAVDVVDLTGAGDAFCGGFLAGICTTGDVIAAARQGAVSASFAIERRGVEGLARADRREAADRLASITQKPV